MEISLGSEYFGRLRVSTRRGWIKLSVLQESIRALALTPLIVTSELYLSKFGGVREGTVAKVGYTEAVTLPCSDRPSAGSDLQTLAKCPLF